MPGRIGSRAAHGAARAVRLWVLAGSAVALAAALVSPAAAGPPTTTPAVAVAHPAGAHDRGVATYRGLTRAQKAKLRVIAGDTWRFYRTAVDPTTALPLDNVTHAGGSRTPTSYGRYTSSANIGVYLWAVVAAHDLRLITAAQARSRIRATLQTVAHLPQYKGFLYQWYDTSTGAALLNPGQGTCPKVGGTFDNCSFLSNVDNGWYASGLVVVRQALPQLRSLADRLLRRMDFGLFYDDRPQSRCNVNPAVGNQPTGQMYGGYYVGNPPGTAATDPHYYHNGALYSDPRISAYLGMGLRQMPGDVWWRSWRTLPPKAPFPECANDPDFSWQGQWPVAGDWRTRVDPRSRKAFLVWEGHYTYPGTGLEFIPTFGGGMFEGLMANAVVPETSWGPQSFGRADRATAKVQIRYARTKLGYPVWGISPSSTADDSGGYNAFGASGQAFPYYGAGANADHPNLRLALCDHCNPETTVTPHASFLALDVAPQQAFANIQRLKRLYPGVYGSGGFFDAVDPTTGSVGHRYLVLDQSMIMASLDNALRDRAMQRHFAADPISRAARTYLGADDMFVD